MSLLAAAGIYLVLDVNSPLPNENLNRYEPWTSYNEFYLEHIFKVVEQFSFYPNTLLFFAGNEVVNDRRSAKASLSYVKAVVRDLKSYIKQHSPRSIPVGYSAADDLQYRISLASYLECEEEESLSVDFYGVNSYQWCGLQSFETSGYSQLVRDYHEYTKPIFFSEYGCNEVQPRVFQEVEALYSPDMIGVFSGGLVYEFSQEPNNYGLVEHTVEGDVYLLPDFHELRNQFWKTHDPAINQVSKFHKALRLNHKYCEPTYENLEVQNGLPLSLAEDFIQRGVNVHRGKFLPLSPQDLTTKFKIFDVDGSIVERDQVSVQVDIFAKDPEEHHKYNLFRNGTYESCESEDDEEEVSRNLFKAFSQKIY